jgi:polysaccharide biosynthesis transport protein
VINRDRAPVPMPADAARGQLPSRNGQLPPPIFDAEFNEAPRHLRDYLSVLHRHRGLAVACFGVTVGLAILVTLLTPRLYTASTRLQVARQSPIQLRLDGNVLRLGDGDRDANAALTFVSAQVAALQSRDLAERVIREHGLATNEAFLHPRPRLRGLLALGEALPRLVRPRGLESAPAGYSERETASRAPAGPALIDRYMRYLKVEEIRGTDIVEVRFTTPDPALSALLAAAHTQAYLDSNEEARRGNDVTAQEFLGRQLDEARKQVEGAEAALSRFAVEHPSVAVNEEQKTVGQRITDLSSQLTKAEGARVALQTRYEFLTRKAPGDLLASFLDRPGIQKLHLALLDLRAERAGLDGRLGPNHPQSQELRRQQAEIEEQLRAEVTQEVEAVRSRYDAARLAEEELRRKLDRLGAKAIELRDLGTRYQLLKNNVETAHALHASLLKQRMETGVNAELVASNVRVIERAEVPFRPSKPNVPLNLTLGVLAGLMLGVGVAFSCEYFDQSVKSTQDVEDLLLLPTLATIPNFEQARRATVRGPHVRRLPTSSDGNGAAARNGNGTTHTLDGQSDLVLLREPWSQVAEAFRSLRTAVLFTARGAPPKVVVVTSAVAAEGKTVGSLNLATALAEAGSRVLLLEADLRHPRCHRTLGVDAARGLASVLAGQEELESVIHSLEAPRLSFIPAGTVPPNPAELVSSARLREIVASLRSRYDFVIVDTPPVLPVTDAVVLAREADAVVLVVRGHGTPSGLVREARDRLLMTGAPLLGVVVNDVDLNWGDLYLYENYYLPPAPEASA